MARVARHAVVSGGLVLAVGTLGSITFSAPACTDHSCEGPPLTEYFMGDLVDPLTYESTRTDETWIAFPGQQWVNLHIGNLLPGCVPYQYEAYISADPNPSQAGNNWTLAGGNVAEFQLWPDWSHANTDLVAVHNDTCASYYLRVVLHCAPLPPPPVDAGLDSARAEAAADAPTDSILSSSNDASSERSPD